MGNVHLVTGFAGKPHVTAADHASLFEAAFRSGQFVMNSGNNFKAALISANQVRISDGEMIMQGRFVRINPAAYEDVAIENGAQGYFRNDLIVMRYTRDADTGIESIGLVSIKGQAVATDPADPQYQVGDINDGGSLINDFPLYRIPLDGLNVGDPVALFALQPSIYDLYTAYKAATDKSLSQLSADKAPAGYGLGTTAKKLSNTKLDSVLSNGWYCFDIGSGIENAPQDFPSMLFVENFYNTGWCKQTITLVGHAKTKIVRSRHKGTWGEWEYENPLMELGKEYRTTERWNGKAVYTKLVDCGAFPSGGTKKDREIGSGVTKILRAEGTSANSGFTVPYTDNTACVHISATLYQGTALIILYVEKGDLTADSCIAQIWYTKD